MKPNDLLKQISVKIESPSKGSGVIYFPQGQEDKIYILTAKHCLYPEESKRVTQDDNIVFNYFDNSTSQYLSYTLNETDQVLISDNPDIDLAVICIPKEAISITHNSECPIKLTEDKDTFNRVAVWGFPESRTERKLKNILGEFRYSDTTHVCEVASSLTSDAVDVKSIIEGMSGGAIVIIGNEEVLLSGISTDFKSDSYRFEGVAAATINIILAEFNLPQETIFTINNSYRYQEVHKIAKDIKEHVTTTAKKLKSSVLPVYKIISDFKNASNDLATHRNSFQNLPNSNIERKEVKELYDWIQNDNTKQKIGMLTGDAGSGKSVILRDLFFMLGNDNTAVLGIKSDKNYAGTLKKLRQKTGLTEDIKKMVLKLSDEGKRTVILIDQIDALSLSHSVNSKYLNTIKILVHSLKGVPGVKIILSVRKWDLTYNPELNIVDVNDSGDNFKLQREFSVSLLKIEQVESILQQLEINLHTFPKSLLELLKTPLHLDIFTGVYSSEFDLKSLRNLHDLYTALWKEKIYKYPKKIKPKKCTKLLNKITQQTNISTSELKYQAKFSKELEYLKSSGILIGDGKTVQLFHQSFHDFVFAKNFVESNMSVYDFLMENHQNLKIRVKLKMIINYLREYDEREYLSVMQNLINSEKISYHIKSLLISLLGYRNNPTKGEETIAFQSILTCNNLKTPFLEAAEGEEWLTFFIEEKVIDNMFFPERKKTEVEKDFIIRTKESRRFASHLLARKLPNKMNLILKYVQNLEYYESKQANVLRILLDVKDWNSTLVKEIYAQYKPSVDDKDLDYWNKKILGDAAKVDSPWAIDSYRPYLEELSKDVKVKKDFRFNYDDLKLAEELFKVNPEQSFLLYLEMIEKLCNNSIYGDYPLKPSYFFDTYSYNPSKKSQRNEYNFGLVDLMIGALKNMSQNSNNFFNQFISGYKNSNYTIILHIMIHGFATNSEVYHTDIFNLIISLNDRNALSQNSSFAFSLRQLINQSYSYFSQEQKIQLNEVLLNVKSPYESYSVREKEDNLKISNNVGVLSLRYLMAIPERERRNFLKINHKYHELKRKFGNLEDKSSDSFFRMGPVPAPFPPAAYDYLSIEKWQESFEKYDSNYIRDMFKDTGSRESHADYFKKQIIKRPNYFINYIQKLVKDDEIYYLYKLAAIRGLFDANFDIEVCASIYENLIELPEMDKYAYDLIQMAEKFIQKKKITKNILDYLIFQALNNTDPTVESLSKNKEQNERHGVIASTNRGLAAGKLTQINFDTAFKNKIFSPLDKIITNDFVEVLIPILVNLKWHLTNDRETVLQLFLKMVDRFPKDKILLFNGLDCSRFLSQSHFVDMEDYLIQAAQVEQCQKSVSIILAWARNRGEKEAEIMHEELCLQSENARKVLPAIASYGLKDDYSNELMQSFFVRGLSDNSIEVKYGYSDAFMNFSVDDFLKIYHLLRKYSKSPVSIMNFRSYYKYLQKCSDRYPKKCLKLMQNFENNSREDVEGNGHFNSDEPLKVILGALNSLETSSKKNKKYIALGMKLFNKLSQYPNLRRYAQDALIKSEN